MQASSPETTTISPPPPPPPPPHPVALLAPSLPKDSRNFHCLLVTSLVSVLFVLSFSSSSFSSPSTTSFSPPSSSSYSPPFSVSSLSSLPTPPSLAYLISGSTGDGDRVLRLLHAVYHPRNLYLILLDRVASHEERKRVAFAVEDVPVFSSVGNVHVVGDVGFANPSGSSRLASILHGAAVLLRLEQDWDWFVNLDASDYPLVTQDDLLHIMAFLPRDFNFVQHTSHLDSKELQRLKPVLVDPSLYLSSNTDVYYGTQRRDLPDAFRLFTGSASVILNRKFIEFCILGTNNLPRELLMYYANARSAHTNYFHTVLCNSKRFNETVFNNNLHYASRATSHKHALPVLGLGDLYNLTQSGAAFGSPFSADASVLDHIDHELLNRLPGKITPGGWCLGSKESSDPCTVSGEVDVLRPGPGARRLEKIFVQLLSNGTLNSHQCKWE